MMVTNTNVKIFGLTRLRVEPTIYRTPGEHVNRYATDAVPDFIDVLYPLRRKSKDWLAQNKKNVSEWSDMSTSELLLQ
jgi:hypothetical protein